jgi:two-component system, response regulator
LNISRANEKYVLLVEDSSDDVILTQLAFKKAQITNPLKVVWDGVEALEFIFCQGRYADRDPNNKPAVILLDLKLPQVDGLKVLKQIRADTNTLEIPVMVLTSSMEAQDQRACYRLGVSDYLQKPTDFTKFFEIVKQIKSEWLD